MLIIAALNLPSTAVFETNANDASNSEAQRSASQSFQSLVRNEPEEPEPKSHLPFDFSDSQSENINASSISNTPSIKSKSPKPPKSIVDERASKPIKSGSAPLSAGASIISSGRVSGGVSPRDSSWDAARTVHLVQHQLQNTTMASNLNRIGSEDDDVKLEHERFAKDSHLKDLSQDPSPIVNGVTPLRRRKNSGHISVNEQGDEFLYLKFHIDVAGSANRGLFNALSNAVENGDIDGYKSVGTLGMNTDILPRTTKDEISEALRLRSCHPVFISDSEREGHYDQYCKEFLWPTFHCQIPDIPRSKSYEEHSWGDYVAVNQTIADKVVEIYQPGDIVWVHDYHLMLVPEMVREKLPKAAIGFFLHIAFPSSEVFRCLAYRGELLSGVLASNSIAFHIPEYAQHFKMSVARILAVDITGPNVIETADHDAFITSYPIGIDVAHLDRILDRSNPNSAVQQHRKVIRQRWPHQRLIASRDKVDPVRGLPQKLRAFDKFLSDNPHLASKVVLVQICNSSAHVFESSGIESIVDQINSKYGDIASGVQPVVLLKQDVIFEQYLALLSEADGFCVSCLRDGMNLTCHEYIYCNDRSRLGPLILSEFTGSASVLGQYSLLINPWNQDQLAQSFKTCLDMPMSERERRWLALRREVESHPAAHWATKLTKEIHQAWQDEMSRTSAKPNIAELERIYHSVQGGEHRVFVLEVEPALTSRAQQMLEEEEGEKAKYTYKRNTPTEEMRTRGSYYTDRLTVVLRDLCNDPRNIVYITSAESPDHMERIYRSLPGLGLIAEFGKFVRYKDSEEWLEIPDGDKTDWKVSMEPWLKLLRERNLASHITMHESSIVVEFFIAVDTSDERDLSTVGEYISLINDHYARELGVRTKLEGNILTLYRSSLGVTRKRAFGGVLKRHEEAQIGMLMIANQPFATEADDVIYDWAEQIKATGRARELVTTVVGKHPSHAHYMVEGTNALLNLLQVMRTKEPHQRTRESSRKKSSILADIGAFRQSLNQGS